MTSRPQTLKGVGLMLAAMAMLPFLDVCAKYLGQQGIPVIQIVWARVFMGALLTLPFAASIAGVAGLKPNLPVIHTARAILLIAATAFFFWGLGYLPIADTLAIFFVQPLLVTALSPFLLGERVGWRRWTAVLVGFAGVLVIIRPGFKELNPGVFLALASGASMAFYLILTRRITGSAHAIVTTFHTNSIGAALLSAIVAWWWVWPSPSQAFLFVLVGLIAVLGHYLIVRSYDHAEASLLAPLAYTEVIMAVAAGWYFFGDFPDLWTFAGVGILIACAIYISWRERLHGAAPQGFEQP
jgi:drug/metabolite transporter (DMT)-like permease